MKAASAPDTFFMIQYLPIYLTDFARSWLNNLRKGTIKQWANLERALYNHFEGAYTKPGTSWACEQSLGKGDPEPDTASLCGVKVRT